MNKGTAEQKRDVTMKAELYYVQIAQKMDEHAAGAPKFNGAFYPAFIEYYDSGPTTDNGY